MFYLIRFHTSEINGKILGLLRHIPQVSAQDIQTLSCCIPQGCWWSQTWHLLCQSRAAKQTCSPCSHVCQAKRGDQQEEALHFPGSWPSDSLEKSGRPFPCSRSKYWSLRKNLYEYKLFTSLRSAVAIIGTHLPGLPTDKAPQRKLIFIQILCPQCCYLLVHQDARSCDNNLQ